MRHLPAFVTLASLVVTLLVPQALAGEAHKFIKLHQDPPLLTIVDIAPAGHSDGDMLAFEAALTGEDGAKATLYGLLITEDIPNGSDTQEDRSGQLYFDFGNGNSIVVAGRSVYAKSETEMNTAAPQLRAIIGGTGVYIGARGQVSTAHNADKSYDHVVELMP